MDYIYMRVSTEDQLNDNQRPKLIAAYPGATEVVEKCSSGKTRHILEALIDDLKPGDRIIPLRVDRLSRNGYEFAQMMQAISKKGAIYIAHEQPSVTQNENFESKLMSTIVPLLAESEKTLISGRTKDAWNARKKRLESENKKINMPHNYHVSMARKLAKEDPDYLKNLPPKSGYIAALGLRGQSSRKPLFRPKAMLEAIADLRGKGMTWARLVEKLSHMQPKDSRYSWTVTGPTAKKIHEREAEKLKQG